MQTLVAIGLGVVCYTLGMMALQSRGRLPSWVRLSGPLVILETRRFPVALERLARRRRLWQRIADGGVVVSMALLVVSMGLVLFAAYLAVTRDVASEVNRPRNALVVPGINDFLPLAATGEIVVGLFVGIAIHELSHAILARVEDIDVESMGLIFLTIVPFGAFVDMDGKEAAASRAGQNRIYAAGVTANLLVAIGCALVLIALVGSSVSAIGGLAVASTLPGTPADDAGIERGDVLTEIDGVEIDGETAFAETLADANESVVVDRADGDSVTVNRSVTITGSPDTGPNTLEPGTTVVAVNDTTVATESAFERELAAASETDPEVSVTVVDQTQTERSETVVVGAFVTELTDDGPLAEAGAPTGEPAVITHIGDHRLVTHEDLFGALEAATAGETVSVGVATDDGYEEYSVTLGTMDKEPYLGVVPQAGIGGLLITDFGVEAYPAAEHLAVLSGEGHGDVDITGTPVDRLLALSFLPFAGMIGLVSENFGGFVGSVTDFYTVAGPLATLEGGVFVFATILFWTGWFSLLIGFFNCLPAYPLDGGRLIKTNVTALATRRSLSAPERIGTLVAGAATTIAAISVLIVLFGPMLVG